MKRVTVFVCSNGYIVCPERGDGSFSQPDYIDSFVVVAGPEASREIGEAVDKCREMAARKAVELKPMGKL